MSSYVTDGDKPAKALETKKKTGPNQTQNPALQNEAVWLTQLRLSRNMNIEKMNARTPRAPQGNVEGASTFTDATSLMGRGASAPPRRDVPLA